MSPNEFQARLRAVQQELARALAHRDGLIAFPSSGVEYSYTSQAGDLIADWQRSLRTTPGRTPQDPLEEFCHQATEIEREFDRHRRELSIQRARLTAPKPEPVSDTVTIRVRDLDTGKIVRLTVPASAVA